MRSKHQKGAENPSAFLCTVPDFLRLFPPNLHNLFFFYDFTVSPDSLQIIEKPVLFIKYMHDHIAVIHENPAGIAVSLDLLCFKSSTSKLFLNIVYDRLNLVGVGAACDYKVICNYGNSMNIDYLDILSFFIINCLAGNLCHHFFCAYCTHVLLLSV